MRKVPIVMKVAIGARIASRNVLAGEFYGACKLVKATKPESPVAEQKMSSEAKTFGISHSRGIITAFSIILPSDVR